MDLEEIKKRLRPTEKEYRENSFITKKVVDAIKNEGYDAVVCGSFARDTFVTGDKDADIFFFFEPNVPREELEKKGLDVGKKVLKKYKPVTHFAEHPYTKAEVDGLTVELVPCYRITDKIISAVDRSPLHNDYLKAHLKPEQGDEVRLLKQFLKANECYGADQKMKGFSGYLTELLILNYGSFEGVLKAASKWGKKTTIDVENKRKDYGKFIEPLIVIDPVDADRNVAAAVSRTTLSRFMWRSRMFLKKPNAEFFFPKLVQFNAKAAVSGRRLIGLSFSCPDVIEEIVWSQLERLTQTFKEKLMEYGFDVIGSEYWTDESKHCAIVFELTSLEINQYFKHKGPEIWDAENVDGFVRKNKDYFFYRSRIYAWKKRTFTKADEALASLAKQIEFVPSYLQKPVSKGKIKEGHDLPEDALKRYFSV